MIRALVIDDSAFNRVTISRMLESSGDVQVVATAIDGQDGIRQALRHTPDVITLDLEMPGMDGFSFLRWLMSNKPTPVIAVSSKTSDRSVFKALELGAADFITKPGGNVSIRLEEIQADLLAKIRSVGQVHLSNLAGRARSDPPVPASMRATVGELAAIDLVVMGASTGGPPALQTILQTLPLLNIPVVVAQHMPQSFTRLFAERLDRLTRFIVAEAVGGQRLMPGHVYIAPGGMQTEVRTGAGGLVASVTPRSTDDLYAPSVNRLFSSASRACGDRVLAIVLTGMGDDGARGVSEVRERGGKTMAESEESAIIFGMPGEAIRTGAVDSVVPVAEIPAAILRLCEGC